MVEDPETALFTGGTVNPEDEAISEDAVVELLKTSDEGAAEEDTELEHSEAIRC